MAIMHDTISDIRIDKKLPIQLIEKNQINESTKSVEASIEPTNYKIVESSTKKTRNIDILRYIFGTVDGKDKLVKLLKCILDLLNSGLFVSSPRTSYSLARPLLIIFHMLKKMVPRISKARASFISQQLSIFRYILRFGGTPFRVSNFVKKVRHLNLSNYQKQLINESTLQEVIDIYYGVFDELDLLYKLNFWNNSKIYDFVVKQEALSWQADILLNLKQNYFKLQNIKRKNSQVLKSNLEGKELKLEDLSLERMYAYLDLMRLSFDCVANIIDMTNVERQLPRGTYPALSLISGTCGFIKLWLSTRKQLEQIL